MKGIQCICGGNAPYKKTLRFNGYTLDGWKCSLCKEEYYNPELANRILHLNKIKKFGCSAKLSKVRSNLILRIPKDLGDALNLKKGGEVRISLDEKDRIIVTGAENINTRHLKSAP